MSGGNGGGGGKSGGRLERQRKFVTCRYRILKNSITLFSPQCHGNEALVLHVPSLWKMAMILRNNYELHILERSKRTGLCNIHQLQSSAYVYDIGFVIIQHRLLGGYFRKVSFLCFSLLFVGATTAALWNSVSSPTTDTFKPLPRNTKYCVAGKCLSH